MNLISIQDDGARPRLLIVEDELLIALALCDKLGRLGCDVIGPAPTVAKALSLIETEPPDAALLDENLDGVSVAPVALELSRRQIPFAVVSGHSRSPSNEPVLQKASRAPKPATLAQIERVLQDLLYNSQSVPFTWRG